MIVLLGLCVCERHEHAYSEVDCENVVVCSKCGGIIESPLGHTTTVGVCRRCGKMQNNELVSMLNTNFTQLMSVGDELISCIVDVSAMSKTEQYSQFQHADKYVAQMQQSYEKIVESCKEEDSLNGLVYQICLLQNMCPDPIIKNDEYSLNNQKTLYQLYLQQISSSFNFLSEYMSYLAGNRDMPAGVSYYEEVSDMPTPDSVIYDISYDSEQTDAGVKQYMYLIGDNESVANTNYNIYLSALELSEGLEIKIENPYTYVMKDSQMVSAMMAGNDAQKGYFLIVSFREGEK